MSYRIGREEAFSEKSRAVFKEIQRKIKKTCKRKQPTKGTGHQDNGR
jgi:hypothetical protein